MVLGGGGGVGSGEWRLGGDGGGGEGGLTDVFAGGRHFWVSLCHAAVGVGVGWWMGHNFATSKGTSR